MATERFRDLPDRVTALEPTKIRVMFSLAEQHDGDLVRLEIGEPDFDTPEHIVDAATEAARAGKTQYTTGRGVPELREAIAEKSAREHDLDLDPADEIMVTAGAMEAICLALLTVAEPDSDVIIPTPAWPNYVIQARIADANPVQVAMPPERGFELDPDRIADAMSEDTSAVVLNSPSNPTGRIHDREAVEAVVDAAADHGAYVIADEVYSSLTFEGEPRSMVADIDDRDRTFVVNSCSKQYAMTGWRVAWLAGPESLIDNAVTLHPGTTLCASTPSQYAAIGALEGSQEPIEEMHDAFARRRDYVAERVAGLPEVTAATPEGAFYAFLDVSAVPGSSFEIAKRLLEEHEVVTVPGDGFGPGGEGFLRISFANSLERIGEGFDRIEAFLDDELA
ncbi:MAG: pyridoxal phosphate-dependent aminotransferase [Haloarculaceae archaeon]